jgi:hypothetical protein
MPSAISIRGYAFMSVAAGVMVVLSKWMQHEQFYPTLVALGNSKTAIVVCGPHYQHFDPVFS